MSDYLSTVWNVFWLLQFLAAAFVGWYGHRFEGEPFKRLFIQMLWGVPFFFACKASIIAIELKLHELPDIRMAVDAYSTGFVILLFVSLTIVATADFLGKRH